MTVDCVPLAMVLLIIFGRFPRSTTVFHSIQSHVIFTWLCVLAYIWHFGRNYSFWHSVLYTVGLYIVYALLERYYPGVAPED